MDSDSIEKSLATEEKTLALKYQSREVAALDASEDSDAAECRDLAEEELGTFKQYRNAPTKEIESALRGTESVFIEKLRTLLDMYAERPMDNQKVAEIKMALRQNELILIDAIEKLLSTYLAYDENGKPKMPEEYHKRRKEVLLVLRRMTQLKRLLEIIQPPKKT